MNFELNIGDGMAARITKEASKQTYWTIRLLVDRERVGGAFRAYGYFRWVDDAIDAEQGNSSTNLAFATRQRNLLESLYRGELPQDLADEEQMLVKLVGEDSGRDPRLRSYLHNMMTVMEFDAGRRGRVISQVELKEYTRALATAVTDAMFYFIGYDDPAPINEARYLSVTAAHITHMLRDILEDVEMGYFNIPSESLEAQVLTSKDVEKGLYREWVFRRVQLARRYFEQGARYLSQVKNTRCRLAGYAYTARFEGILRAIERDDYYLRREYPERRSLSAGVRMVWQVMNSMLTLPINKTSLCKPGTQHIQVK